MSIPGGPSSPARSTCGLTRRLSLIQKFGTPMRNSPMKESPGVASLTLSTASAQLQLRGREVRNEGSMSIVGGGGGRPGFGVGSAEALQQQRIMPPPPPPPPTTPKKGAGQQHGAIHGFPVNNMRKLLEDLHRSRVSFEMDRQALKQSTAQRQDLDKKISKMQGESKKASEKFQKLGQMAAYRRTELNALEIKNRVVDQTTKKAEEDLNQALDELHQLRIQISDFATTYLTETLQFGLQWNGTVLGRENRVQFDEKEIENLERQKRHLEFELTDFLTAKRGVDECEKELEDLNQQYREKDEAVEKQSNELQQRIDELDATLKELEREEEESQRTSKEEMDQLQKQADEIQRSIASIQNQSAEAKAAVKTQKSSNKRIQNQDVLELQNQQLQHDNNDAAPYSTASTSDFDSKSRLSKFQVPVKPQIQSNVGVVKGYTDTSNDKDVCSEYFCNSEGNSGSNSNSNDEDMCLVAAAAEVSQSLRAHENPKYTHQGPPPKVRAVERQVPITGFMKQLSSTKVIKRPNKSSQGRNKNNSNNNATNPSVKPFVQPVAPVLPSIHSTGKTFQFKKKVSFGNTQVESDKENSSVNSESCFNDSSDYSNNNDTSVPALFDDMPYSNFTTSRALLTESQEKRFGLN